jgi:hypothetical protein
LGGWPAPPRGASAARQCKAGNLVSPPHRPPARARGRVCAHGGRERASGLVVVSRSRRRGLRFPIGPGARPTVTARPSTCVRVRGEPGGASVEALSVVRACVLDAGSEGVMVAPEPASVSRAVTAPVCKALAGERVDPDGDQAGLAWRAFF